MNSPFFRDLIIIGTKTPMNGVSNFSALDEKNYRIEEIQSWEFDVKEKGVQKLLEILKNIEFDKNTSILEKIFYLIRIFSRKDQKILEFLSKQENIDLFIKYTTIIKYNPFTSYQLMLLLYEISTNYKLTQSYILVRGIMNIILVYEDSTKISYDLKNNLFLQIISILVNVKGKGLIHERKDIFLFINKEILELEESMDENCIKHYNSLKEKLFKCGKESCTHLTYESYQCQDCGLYYCSKNCLILDHDHHKSYCYK